MDNNPWKHVWIDDKVAETNPYLNPKAQKPEPEQEPDPIPGDPNPSQSIKSGIIEMPRTNTYALGVQALQEQCRKEKNKNHPQFLLPNGSKVYRPLTFKETIEARVNEYESHKPDKSRLNLFNTWKASGSGIAYKKESTKFKLQTQCLELITIDSAFAQNFLPMDYAKFSGKELDSSRGKYNVNLTSDEILTHPAWLAVMEDDKALLRTYRDIVFHELAQRNAKKQPPKDAMGFYVLQNTAENQLRAVYVDDLDLSSGAGGDVNLGDSGRFLRGSP